MDTLLKAALQAPAFRLFAAFKVTLPNGDTIRLLNGDAVLPIAGETYVGQDATYGAMEDLQQISDGVSGDAPGLQATLLAPSLAAVDALIDPAVQGSAVTVSVGAVDSVTGLCIGVPEPFFLGEVDVGTFLPSGTQRAVELECNSVFERFFDRDEGQRLSPAYWETVFPGDKACDDVTGLVQKVAWGQASVGPETGPDYGAMFGPVGGAFAKLAMAQRA